MPKVKLWMGKEQEIEIVNLDVLTEDEITAYFHEWLIEKADAGYEILNDETPDDDTPHYLHGTKATEDSLKDYYYGEIAW